MYRFGNIFTCREVHILGILEAIIPLFRKDDIVIIKNTIHRELNNTLAEVMSCSQASQQYNSQPYYLYRLRLLHSERTYFVCAEHYLDFPDFHQ